MLDAGRHRLEAGGLHAAHDLLRHRGGGDVDLVRRQAEQRVAHRAADHARLLAVAVEHGEQPRQRAGGKPRLVELAIGAAFVPRHYLFVLPGTNLPFSICAGT